VYFYNRPLDPINYSVADEISISYNPVPEIGVSINRTSMQYINFTSKTDMEIAGQLFLSNGIRAFYYRGDPFSGTGTRFSTISITGYNIVSYNILNLNDCNRYIVFKCSIKNSYSKLLIVYDKIEDKVSNAILFVNGDIIDSHLLNDETLVFNCHYYASGSTSSYKPVSFSIKIIDLFETLSSDDMFVVSPSYGLTIRNKSKQTAGINLFIHSGSSIHPFYFNIVNQSRYLTSGTYNSNYVNADSDYDTINLTAVYENDYSPKYVLEF
jgi:hypothetical protein